MTDGRQSPAAPGETNPAMRAAQIYEARIAASSYLTTALLSVLVERGVLERGDVASILQGMRQAVAQQLEPAPADADAYLAEFEHITGRIAAAFDLSGGEVH